MGFFTSSPYRDPELGELKRSRGHWRGSITLPSCEPTPLVIEGGRNGPDAAALELARDARASFVSWRASIALALFEHLAPALENDDDEEFGALPPGVRDIASADEVWPYVSLRYVAVTSQARMWVTELGYAVSWDDDHTLGARFSPSGFVELCGSVLPP
jgi:hypothetical protein